MGRRREGEKEQGVTVFKGGMSVRNAEVQVVKKKECFKRSYMAEKGPKH